MSFYHWISFFLNISLVITYGNLSYRKFVSQSTTDVSPTNASVAGNAVDGDKATCMRTNSIGTDSPDETVSWKVDLGGVYNIYSINISFKNYEDKKMQQRDRFAGFSLYLSNSGDIETSTLCYRDGPKLPPLNFTTSCHSSGRYVIFYNDRLKGVMYPAGYEVLTNVFMELCEVTVTACFFGWYGYRCMQRCSGHFKDRPDCHHVTGVCDLGCATGWTGSRYNVLMVGTVWVVNSHVLDTVQTMCLVISRLVCVATVVVTAGLAPPAIYNALTV